MKLNAIKAQADVVQVIKRPEDVKLKNIGNIIAQAMLREQGFYTYKRADGARVYVELSNENE